MSNASLPTPDHEALVLKWSERSFYQEAMVLGLARSLVSARGHTDNRAFLVMFLLGAFGALHETVRNLGPRGYPPGLADIRMCLKINQMWQDNTCPIRTPLSTVTGPVSWVNRSL